MRLAIRPIICGVLESDTIPLHGESGIYVSKMSGKVEGFHSINTNAIDNPFCEEMSKSPSTVCSRCYSRRMSLTFRANCNLTWSQNGYVLSKCVIPVETMPELSWFTCNGAFRLSSHGELINETHLINYFNIAQRNPKITFGLWTKRITMVQGHLDEVPENMVLVASHPLIDVLDPRLPDGFDRAFNVYTREFAEKHDIPINCIGKCRDCMVCYQKRNGMQYISELLK